MTWQHHAGFAILKLFSPTPSSTSLVRSCQLELSEKKKHWTGFEKSSPETTLKKWEKPETSPSDLLPVFFWGGGWIFSHVTVGACGGPRGCFAFLIDNHEVTPHVVDSVEIRSCTYLFLQTTTWLSWQSRWIFPEHSVIFEIFVGAFLGSVNRSTWFNSSSKEFCPATQRVFQEQIDHLLLQKAAWVLQLGTKGWSSRGSKITTPWKTNM